MARTLGPYPRGSRFDPDRRPCLLDEMRAHGPEALTVERPVETRQEELRALPGPPIDARQDKGREPDGDGAALIPREDVVRLHDALPTDDE